MANIIDYNLLWQEISSYTKKAGRASARPVLLLYYVMISADTPRAEKVALATAIAYVVLPIDLIKAKRIPIIGWLDEVLALSVAYNKVCKYITPEMEHKVDALLDKWFFLDESVRSAERPDYIPYIEVK